MNTAYTQQYNILLDQHHFKPDASKQFVMDIIKFIHRWQSMHDILLCLNANNNTVESRDHGIERIINKTALINLHQYRHLHTPSPATYNRGHLTIDYCLGTKGFAQALTAAWMLPFGLPPTLSGNHQTLGLEFDHDVLFGQKIPQATPSPQ